MPPRPTRRKKATASKSNADVHETAIDEPRDSHHHCEAARRPPDIDEQLPQSTSNIDEQLSQSTNNIRLHEATPTSSSDSTGDDQSLPESTKQRHSRRTRPVSFVFGAIVLVTVGLLLLVIDTFLLGGYLRSRVWKAEKRMWVMCVRDGKLDTCTIEV